MTFWLSKPIEELLNSRHFDKGANRRSSKDDARELTVKTLIIGSGYGAAMSALAIAEQQKNKKIEDVVWVFERGNEYVPDDFPKTIADVPGYFSLINSKPGDKSKTLDWQKRLNPNQSLDNALWDIRVGVGVTTVSGSGLGGTSLVNANVAIQPDEEIYQTWPALTGVSWGETLEPSYKKIKQLLGVNVLPDAKRFSKYQALEKTAKALGATATPVDLAINFDQPTEYSADHGPCNHCGNCIVGCHSGAKGSLNMNAWPLARQLGVQLYTSVTVSSIEKAEGGWFIHCFVSRNEDLEFKVFAERVVLSAGTIGSTEILMRSEKERGLQLSDQLGKRFSTNGDALIFGAGQENKVNALAPVPQENLETDTPPGPTIIGKVTANLATAISDSHEVKNKFILEDGAIPFALKTLWKELITSQTFIKGYVSTTKTAWHKQHPDKDPLASYESFADHSQILLAMGIDNNEQGELVTDTDGIVIPTWTKSNKEKGTQDYFEGLHETFKKAEEQGGFDGGQYLPNPAWKPLPEGFGDFMEGADKLAENLISVHPLGGCGMGESSKTGVVNHKGQVFRGKNTQEIYEGLYVLDGSILPGAVGVNPFLTIAALSYTLALDIIPVADKVVAPSFTKLTEKEFRTLPEGAKHQTITKDEEKISAVFEEELNCHFSQDRNSLSITDLNKLLNFGEIIPKEARHFIVSIKIFFGENEKGFGSPQQTITEWLEQPSMQLKAEAVLSYDISNAVHSTPKLYQETIGTIQGTVRLGGLSQPKNRWVSLVRVGKVLLRYYKFRPHDWIVEIVGFVKGSKNKDNSLSTPEKKLGVFGKIADGYQRLMGYLRVAKLHTNYRSLEYEFSDTLVLMDQNKVLEGISFSGKKELAYASDKKDLWSALVTLPVVLSNKQQEDVLTFDMDVDLIKMLKGPSPIQITQSPNSPASVMAMLAVGGYFLRSIAQTHFWSFGAPSYNHLKTRTEQEQPRDKLDSRMMEPPKIIFFGDGQPSQERETFKTDDGWSRLVRYQPKDDETTANPENRKSLLLIHGLAHSGRVFWTETIDVNAVQYFLSQNYDVWVIDHRTSANTIEKVDPDHTWDDIAKKDVPWAVETIFNEINKNQSDNIKKVFVFAHCIGAGAVGIAALIGKLNYSDNGQKKSMIAAMAPHAVTPWLYASEANRARENVWGIFKDWGFIKTVEPLPHADTEGVEMIFDRLASAQIDEKERKWWKRCRDYKDIRGVGFPRTLYSRYTLFWGRQWNHENINESTRYNFARMIGATPVAVLQQVYYSITQGRLTSHEGANNYVNSENLKKNWTFPTLFLHGNKNTVFDIHSSRLSAERLARYRHFERLKGQSGIELTAELTAKDYADNNVWLEIFDNYGHMDVIFGEKAYLDVFPKIDAFFQAAEQQSTLTPAYEGQLEQVNAPGRIPALGSSIFPITGPILSRPRKGEGKNKNTLRLWVEEWDVTDELPSGFSIGHEDDKDHCIERCHSDVDTLAKGRSEDRPRETFHLLDYEFDGTIKSAQDFMVEYGEKDLNKNISQHNKEGLPLSDTRRFSRTVSLDWYKMPWFNRLYNPDALGEEQYALSFIVGSCFHQGTIFDRKDSRKAFVKMYDHVEGIAEHVEEGVDHLLLLGDQIYADAYAQADVFDPVIHYEKFRLRYRDAFANEEVSKLFRNVPVYFAVDDHEFTDNWQGRYTEDVTEKDFEYAKSMARLFQVHDDKAWDKDQGLWYEFEARGFPFFVMDTRMERKDLNRAELNALITDSQMAGFKQWVIDSNDSDILFISSGSTIAPISRGMVAANSLAMGSDRLIGYSGFLEQMIDVLFEFASRKTIIWMSGDPHFSSLAKCCFQQGEKSINIYQVCSSGIYSPFPFANDNPNEYVWNNEYDWSKGNTSNWKKAKKQSIQLKGSKQPIEMEFVQTLLSSDLSNFVRINLKKNNLVNKKQDANCKININLGSDKVPVLSIEY